MKEILNQILSERGYQPRPHQVRNILDYTSPDKPHVAAIATAGGKTIMTAAKFELYYRCGVLKKTDKVLIIPADKTILRGNFKKQFDDFKPTSFTYCAVEDKIQLMEAIDNDIQVIIALPQFIKDHTKLLKNVKWLVVDEAHKWYFADTIKNIVKSLTPKKGVLHQFLLTGTPFKFNLRRNNYIIDYTSVKTLYSQGFIGDVNMQVLHTSLALTRLDWVSMTDNLRPEKTLSKKDLDKSLSEMIVQLVKKLKLPLKDLHSTHNVTKDTASSLFGKLQKTIIFTHRTDAADVVADYLTTHGVNCITSHSKVGGEIAEESFNSFRENKDIKVLVSVNRGKEGFDFPELYNIIDMTYSQNFEVVMQMAGRLLRPSKKKTYKVFYKVAPKHTSSYFTQWMDCMIQLFDDYWYSKFNGRNTLDIRVPHALLNRPKSDKVSTYIQDGKKKIEIVSGTSLSKGTKIQVVGKDNKKVPLKDGTYKVPQSPTKDNPKPEPIEIQVKKGIIVKTPVRTTRGVVRPKMLDRMGFDLSLSFMEKNKWFKLDDPLSTVATSTLRKIIHQFDGGTIGNRNKKELLFLSFSECKEFVKTIDDKWKSSRVWSEYCQSGLKPENIPSSPYKVFEDEWIDWADWFGTGYLTSKDAMKFVHTLGLKSESEWSKYCQSGDKPDNIPTNFRQVYKNEKISTGKWLGTNRISDWEKVFVTLDELKVLVKEWGINNKTQWYDYWKVNEKPSNIPANPSVIYKREDVWVSWPNLFGLDKRSSGSETMTFTEARTFVRKLKLKGNQGWRDYSKSGDKPTTLPGAPDTFYEEEWTDWKDFLGDETMRTPNKKK